MKTKPLFVMISDGGDGSYYPNYTFNPEFIAMLKEAHDNRKMNYENGIGCDGDGFHYDTINVPEECTGESLGLGHRLFTEEEEREFAERFK